MKKQLIRSIGTIAAAVTLSGCGEDVIESHEPWRLDRNEEVSNEPITATQDDLRQAIVECYEQQGVECENPELACGIYGQIRPNEHVNIFELAAVVSKMGGEQNELEWDNIYGIEAVVPSWGYGPVNYAIANGFMDKERFERDINVTFEDIDNFSMNCSEYFE